MINWKLCGRKRPWPNLRDHPGIFLMDWGILRKTQHSRFMGRDFKPRLPEHKADVLTTRPRRSVTLCDIVSLMRHRQSHETSSVFHMEITPLNVATSFLLTRSWYNNKFPFIAVWTIVQRRLFEVSCLIIPLTVHVSVRKLICIRWEPSGTLCCVV
jgi:hypothetical protein